MTDSNTADAVPKANDLDDRVRERLREDDTAAEPVTEDALVDADTIGSGLSGED